MNIKNGHQNDFACPYNHPIKKKLFHETLIVSLQRNFKKGTADYFLANFELSDSGETK